MTIQSSVYRWYRQGTVAVTNGSTAVTGTTTAWSTNVKAGDGFSLDGATWYEVASVTDNTHLVLASNFGGSTTSGASYAIDRRSLAWQVGSEAAARVLALQQMLQQTLKTTGQPPDTIGSDGAVAYDATAMVFYTNTGGTWDTGTSFRGSTVLNGAGAPSSGTGNNADFYLDTTNTRLYGPKTGGAWGSYVSLVGPTGSTGPTGATGATGPANTLSIGTVTTGAAGSSASATITGTAPTQTLSLTIPRGDTGATGAGTGDALTSNPLSQFAATTSLQLKGVISDETGSGSLVFATSPTLITPALGTPSSGTLTNCTGLPVSGVSGLATSTTTGRLAKYSNTTGSQEQTVGIFEDASGNAGFGTASPWAKVSLPFNGKVSLGQSTLYNYSVYKSSAGNLDVYFDSLDTDVNTKVRFRMRTGGTPVEAITFDGNGAIRFPAYGAGTLTTDASGNITASSDEALKDDIQPFTRGLQEILQINPISYLWSAASGLDRMNRYTGFSAQNVETAIPEAVGVDANGYLTLIEKPILAALVNAVKALSEQNAALAARIEALEQGA